MKFFNQSGLARALVFVWPFACQAMQLPTAQPSPLMFPRPLMNNLLGGDKTLKQSASTSNSPMPRTRRIAPSPSPEPHLTPTMGLADRELKIAKQKNQPIDPLAQERADILAHAFNSLGGNKELPQEKQGTQGAHTFRARILDELPYDIQEHIAHIYLDTNHNNIIRRQMKKLLPAIIDHHTQEGDNNIFASIAREEERLKKILNEYRAMQNNAPKAAGKKPERVHWIFSAPLEDGDVKLMADKFENTPFFDGDPREQNAFIAEILADGAINYYVNAHNRNRLRALTPEQINYLIGLYNSPQKLAYAKRWESMHRSLPKDILEQVEDNYEFTLPASRSLFCC